MKEYKVTFTVPVEVVVYIEAQDEEIASEIASEMAQERLFEVGAYTNDVAIFGDLDGVCPEVVEDR